MKRLLSLMLALVLSITCIVAPAVSVYAESTDANRLSPETSSNINTAADLTLTGIGVFQTAVLQENPAAAATSIAVNAGKTVILNTIEASVLDKIRNDPNKEIISSLFLSEEEIDADDFYSHFFYDFNETCSNLSQIASTADLTAGTSISAGVGACIDAVKKLTKTSTVAMMKAFDLYQDMLDGQIDMQNNTRTEMPDEKPLNDKTESKFSQNGYEYTYGSGKDLQIRIDQDDVTFAYLSIGGIRVPEFVYKVEKGSTIVTIDHRYLDKFKDGCYNVTFNFKEESKSTPYTTLLQIHNPNTPSPAPKYSGEVIYSSDVETGNPIGEKEYYVIIIDVSHSMKGEPLEAAKKSSKELASKILANPNAEISVITLYKDSEVNVPMTNDLNKVNSGIDKLTIMPGTNFSSSLRKADSILSSYDSGKKSMILLSDGAPTSGETEYDFPGLVGFLDTARWDLINGSYDIKKKFNDKYDIYTIGFYGSYYTNFDNMDPNSSYVLNEKENSKLLMKALSNKGYYASENVDELIDGFSNLANDLGVKSSSKILANLLSQDDEFWTYRITEIYNADQDSTSINNLRSELIIDENVKILDEAGNKDSLTLNPGDKHTFQWDIQVPKAKFKEATNLDFSIKNTSDDGDNTFKSTLKLATSIEEINPDFEPIINDLMTQIKELPDTYIEGSVPGHDSSINNQPAVTENTAAQDTKPNESNSQTSAAKTGDNIKIVYMTIALIVAIITIALVAKKKRNN